ncbi:MAG TPA: methionyl-tRNA formyltransferase [Cytophagaceae bacterium]|jgi:methionyl-tRNA formyltransferase|nr:methionyl-tRNA formyltransferase [Cytophagaceae bacterium]
MSENKLGIVFMGTPDFAVPSLEILITEKKYDILAVITAPDKPAGRGLKIQFSPVKELALAHNIPVLQPTNLKDEDFIEELKSYNAQLQIVVAFRMLPEFVWNMPPLGTFNLHASLLPQYRGAAPINWAIINGEKETGCTTFFLQHEIDTGDILFSDTEIIKEEDTFEELYTRLKIKGAALVLKTVRAIEKGNYVPVPQQFTSVLKTAPKIHKETCKIDWTKPAEEIRNFIRGLSPYPTAWTTLNGKNLKIFKAKMIMNDTSKSPGEIESDGKTYIHFYTGKNVLSIEELQLEGKKRMTAEEFLRGNKL